MIKYKTVEKGGGEAHVSNQFVGSTEQVMVFFSLYWFWLGGLGEGDGRQLACMKIELKLLVFANHTTM